MGLFDFLGGDKTDPAVEERREASRRNLESGGLPFNAIDRLKEQASRQRTPEHFFTSDLSVNEFLLVRENGYEPLGQVMGSSIYKVGFQWQTIGWSNSSRWNGASSELTVLTTAFYNARHLALGRLAQEAAMLGATGVVGVRLERKEYEWGLGLLEFSAIGTAIRERDVPPPTPDKPYHPFLSELSGEEFWALRQGGFRPVGVAVGNCSYYQIPGWQSQRTMRGGFFGVGSWANQEMTDYTQALYDTRELAMGRMENEARTFGATGIVSVDLDIEVEPHEVENNNQHRTDMLYHFTAIGTAIAPFDYHKPKLDINMILPMKKAGDTNEIIDLTGSF